MGRLYRVKRKIQKKLEAHHRKKTKPNKEALWVFGIQKAGTSAIASLLAHRAGKSATIDSPFLWMPYIEKLQNEEIDLKNHIDCYPHDFSKEIIKEPNATYIFRQIKQNFNLNKYILIIRNPLDNIRSILNRLNIPGDQHNIELEKIHPKWQHLFKSKGNNYVKDLAELWLSIYGNREFTSTDNCILIKYEDFNKDKVKTINTICDLLDYEGVASIDKLKNKNFQPRGNSKVDLRLFFGEENYKLILEKTNKVCLEYYK
jgi:hypothetical protein